MENFVFFYKQMLVLYWEWRSNTRPTPYQLTH